MRSIYLFDTSSHESAAPSDLRLFRAASASSPVPTIHAVTGNPLVNTESIALQLAASNHAVISCLSGWITDEDDRATPSPRTWYREGWDALEHFIRQIDHRLATPHDAAVKAIPHVTGRHPNHPKTLLFWTRAETVLSDAPSSIRFLNTATNWTDPSRLQLGLIVDTVGMLTREMLPAATDHIERITTILGQTPGVSIFVASNLASENSTSTRTPAAHHAHGPVPTAPAHRGTISPRWLGDLLRSHLSPSVAIALINEEPDAQRTALGF